MGSLMFRKKCLVHGYRDGCGSRYGSIGRIHGDRAGQRRCSAASTGTTSTTAATQHHRCQGYHGEDGEPSQPLARTLAAEKKHSGK